MFNYENVIVQISHSSVVSVASTIKNFTAVKYDADWEITNIYENLQIV